MFGRTGWGGRCAAVTGRPPLTVYRPALSAPAPVPGRELEGRTHGYKVLGATGGGAEQLMLLVPPTVPPPQLVLGASLRVPAQLDGGDHYDDYDTTETEEEKNDINKND